MTTGSDPRNIVLITTDQHRWDWLGCHGTPGVATPHLDALAGRGMRVTQHVTNAAICVPARIGLATGISPIRLGALGNADVLPADATTYYQLLRDAGYQVGVVGKLDLNKPDPENGDGARPDTFRWGFTHPVEAEGKMHAAAGGTGRPLGPYGAWLEEQGLFRAFHEDYLIRNGEIWGRFSPENRDTPFTGTHWFADSVLPTEAFEDCWIGRRSCQWIRDRSADQPFHLFVSFVGPHDPFDPPTEYAERFRDADVPRPVLDPNDRRPLAVRTSQYGHAEPELMAARRQYTAALAAIDDQVGDIMATLDAQGVLDETLVIFTSDHGEMLGDHRLFQKHVAYEPSMRIPLIAAGPGVGRGVSDAKTELVDVSATILDAAGIDVPAAMDGRSLLGVFADPDEAHREATITAEHHYRAIRTGDHKYVHYTNELFHIDELYDLRADPDETDNLIEQDTATAARLHEQLTELLGAQFMT